MFSVFLQLWASSRVEARGLAIVSKETSSQKLCLSLGLVKTLVTLSVEVFAWPFVGGMVGILLSVAPGLCLSTERNFSGLGQGEIE